MSEKTIAALDLASLCLLLVWLVFVIGHFIFGSVLTISIVDIAAWIAFGASIVLSGMSRWLYEIADADIVGPFKLWVAASIAALVFCTASSFIATPKMTALQTQLANQNISEQQKELLYRQYAKAHNFSLQFLCIRAALAIGLTLGLRKLPHTIAPK